MTHHLPDSGSLIHKGNRLTGFTIFVVVLCLLNLIINNINHRFFVSDFKVFYYAAKDLMAGGKVYFIAFGEDSGFYKYSPLTLLYFLPFTLLSLQAAAVIHICILSFAYWYTYLLTRKLLVRNFFTGHISHEGWLLSLAVICTMIFLVKELYLGNINILLIMLSLLALKSFLKGNPLVSGILLGLVILTKPFYLVLLLPLLFRKEIRSMAVVVLTMLAGLLIPFLFFGFERNFYLTVDWIKTMLVHNAAYPSMNSMDYLLHYYLFPGLTGPTELVIIFISLCLLAWFILKNFRSEKKGEVQKFLPKQNFTMEWFLILALLPNIFKTDTEHFLASAPVFTFIIYFIAVKRKRWLIPLMVILVFFYGGNSQDLLGADFSYKLFSMGLIGLSNLLIVLLALILFLDFRKRTNLG